MARNLNPLRAHQWGTIVCSSGANGKVKEPARVTLAAGQRLRVALAWSTDADDSFCPGRSRADLDLLVHRVSTG
jgi:hypothetical protein